MDVSERIRNHVQSEIGPDYKDLTAAAERDNAAKASDKALFYILLISIIVTGGLVFYRLLVHTRIRKQTLLELQADEKRRGGNYVNNANANNRTAPAW
nr:envelope protein [White spot syndrome virus]WRY70829.1 envelope protein [White spot syndrome virus]WRY70995.1 envelope protein [White spot syndrome virus]BDX28213.1 MAG: envelope protein VP14 [White spot syndrome virus]BDX28379.1 MAG: envelope protein VP14 [White spot syndrome virus]